MRHANNRRTPIPTHLLDQHRQCEIARKELEEEVRKEMLEKIGFICAYLMEAHMDANELQKLLHNAKLWTSKPMPHFEPVDLSSEHLTKERRESQSILLTKWISFSLTSRGTVI